MAFGKLSVVVTLACLAGCARTQSRPPVKPQLASPVGELKATERIRPDCPIRIGGVVLNGLGDSADAFEESAANGTKLSTANQDWLGAHCDLAVLSPNTITPDTFPALRHRQRLFTPLLYLYASSLYEQPDHKGNVGDWKPEMSAWTLRDHAGVEIKHPDPGGHWMDFGNTLWADHWRKQTEAMCGQFGAFGAVAAEIPLGNTFVGNDLKKYKTREDRGIATEAWLKTAFDPGKYLLIPSAIEFDEFTGHSTPPYPPGTAEPELTGRYWDQLHMVTDGSWAEGWLHPYWLEETLADKLWEVEMEAADRAARTDKVFIVAAAYHDDDELEYALASYLLVAKRQSRVVFQPMPLRPGQPQSAGLSLAVLKRELAEKAAYFDAPLGVALQERHSISISDSSVWRRQYQFGDVYVNSDDKRSVTINLGSPMVSSTGETWQSFVLLPHHGAILRYAPTTKK
ncbi:MAG: hypothetical protein JWN14_365 [Chthonomonadales bacterium]|nr:hypothetical protein [Chthonomonadales bacterium]